MITDVAPRAIYAIGAGGPPVAHEIRFSRFSGAPFDAAGYRAPAEVARCICGWSALIDGGHTDEDRARLARQHATGVP